MSDIDIYAVPEFSREQIAAIQAVARGEANEHQQQLCIKLIVKDIAKADVNLYIPNSFDETAFVNGKAFVGKTLRKIINTPLAKQVGEPTTAEEMKDG